MARWSPGITNFTAGVLSPRARGRTDWQSYYDGCRDLLNMIVTVLGPATRRPGTGFVAEVKDSNSYTVIRPFIFGVEQAYGLEFGGGYMRVYRNRGRIEVAGVPVELSLPYTADQVPLLRFTQEADTLYVVQRENQPRQITRSSHTSWSDKAFDFKDGPYYDENSTDTTLQPSAVTGSVTITASATDGINSGAGFLSTDVGRLIRIKQSSVWGNAKITAVTSTTVVTATVESDFNDTTAVKNWRLGAWSDTDGWPEEVSFDGSRLWFFRDDWRWASRLDAHRNFAPDSADTDAIAVQPRSNQVDAIRWAAMSDRLIYGTAGSEWRVLPADTTGAITPSNINPKPSTRHGAAVAMVAQAFDRLFFVQRQGMKVRALHSHEIDIDKLVADDVSVRADHLFTRGLGGEMAWQEEPWSSLWVNTAAGALLGMTYDPEQKVFGWHPHQIGGTFQGRPAIVQSLTTIPGANGDELWMVVKREIDGATKRYVEFLNDPLWDHVPDEDAIYVDSSLTLDLRNGDSSKKLEIQANDPDPDLATWSNGDTTTLAATGFTPFLPSDIGDVWRLWYEGDAVSVQITGYTSAALVTVELLADVPESLQGATVSKWLDPDDKVDAVSGLDHLEGERVLVYADGAVEPVKTVASGAIALDALAGVITVGLSQRWLLSPMLTEGGSPEGSGQTKMKKITRIAVRLFRTLGISYGPSLSQLNTYEFRKGTDRMDMALPLFTGDIEDRFPGDWDRQAPLVLTHDGPFPATVSMIVPETEVNDG